MGQGGDWCKSICFCTPTQTCQQTVSLLIKNIFKQCQAITWRHFLNERVHQACVSHTVYFKQFFGMSLLAQIIQSRCKESHRLQCENKLVSDPFPSQNTSTSCWTLVQTHVTRWLVNSFIENPSSDFKSLHHTDGVVETTVKSFCLFSFFKIQPNSSFQEAFEDLLVQWEP